ncbi:ionotropic receptor 25a-like [Tetranychus urticae]|nr:ionotropic receptor 25a-like [Tetranychus urticae]
MAVPMITVSSSTCDPESAWVNLNQWEAKHLINFISPVTIFLRSVIDVVNHLQIKNGQIYIEQELAFYLPCLISEPSLVNFTFRTLEINDDTKGIKIQQLIQLIGSSVKQKVVNFIGVGRSSFVNKLIETFRQNNLFRHPFKLIVLSKDEDKIKCFLCKHGQLIAGQPLFLPSSDYDEPPLSAHFHPTKLPAKDVFEFYYYHDLIHLLLQSVNSISDQLNATINGTFSSLSTKQSELSCWTNQSSSDNLKKLITIPFAESLENYGEENYGKLGPFKLTKVHSNDNSITGYQEISIRLKRHTYYADYFDRESIGEWEAGLPNGRIYYTARQSEDSDASDSARVKIAVFLTPPYLTKRMNGSEIIYEGFLIELFDEIRHLLGDKFPAYELVEITETAIGLMEINLEEEEAEEGNSDIVFSGLINEIIQGTYEMALALTEVTEDRTIGVDFSQPIFDLIGFSILMKRPIRESHEWKFITVLEWDVWLCISAAYLFTSILLSIFDRFSPYSFRNRPEKFEHESEECKRIFTLKESLWFCFISLTPQGGGDAPKCISGRLVAAIWWLFGFIFVASYTANLAAFLTVSRLENRVDSMDGLSKQYKIRYAPIDKSAADGYFTKMAYIEDKYYDIWKNLSLDDSIDEDERANLAVWEYPVSDKYTKIKAQIVEAKKPYSLEEGFRRVRESVSASEGFALISTSLDVEYFSYLHCDVYKAEQDFAFHPIALPISKNSPNNLKELIDPIILELKENGFIASLRTKYWENNPERKSCPDWRKLSNGLILADTWGMFLIIGIGLICTLIVISIENCIIIAMRKKKSTVKTKKELIKKFY